MTRRLLLHSVTEHSLLELVPRSLLIAGQWQEAAQGKTFEVRNPATGTVLLSVADASPDDSVRALDAAVHAQDAWGGTSPRYRSDLLRRAFDSVHEHKDELALLITLEMGKPLAEAHAEVKYAAEFLRWFSEEAVRIGGRYGRNPEGTGHMIVSQHPVGPCYLITPWNFPLAMATRKIAPAIAAGCTAVIKPAAPTPLTTLYFARLLESAGLPPGVLNVITSTRSEEVTIPLLADPRLRKLSFTGSTTVGSRLLKQAADSVLRVSMELGGNAPFVVFEDADLDAAVEGALVAKFRNIGQACTAANRFIVHRSLVREFGRRVAERVQMMRVGNGTDPDTDIGPLIDSRAVETSKGLIADAVARGAHVIAGDVEIPGPGTFLAPTVVTDVAPGSSMLSQEIFGPVLAIAPFDSEEEAVRLANDTEYGLVAYVYTRDLGRGHRMIEKLSTGMLGLNVGAVSNAAAPFGGVKKSGMGREGGTEGIQEYLTTKYTLLPAS